MRDINYTRKSQTRVTINRSLRTDADLTAFCIDCFPNVANRFSAGMDRVEKINLLLQLENDVDIYNHLTTWIKSANKAIFQRNRSLPREILYAIFSSFLLIAVIIMASLAGRTWSPAKERKASVISVSHDNGPASLNAATPKPTEGKQQLDSAAPIRNIQAPRKKSQTGQRAKPEEAESFNRQDVIMHNAGPTQVNNIGGRHDTVSIVQNNK